MQDCLHSWWIPKTFIFQGKTLLDSQGCTIRHILFVKLGTSLVLKLVFKINWYLIIFFKKIFFLKYQWHLKFRKQHHNWIYIVILTCAQKTPNVLKRQNFKRMGLKIWWCFTCFWAATLFTKLAFHQPSVASCRLKI